MSVDQDLVRAPRVTSYGADSRDLDRSALHRLTVTDNRSAS
jgi:hypothetical protein